MKIKNVEHGTYDFMEAVQVEYDNGKKFILFNSDKEELKQIYKTDINKLTDIINLEIKNYDYIVKGGKKA